ncbi:helix-turn-helix domain-containing protein [Frankia sp. Cpl3]|uniref:helix-turn-helix domain-containing protein n=1 Tax=Parafrankia colletiae TaxID=573497 RepID=UPI001F52098B|nr:helix-turn-helix domain-containing protein [Frankia sp. Cpl3]
MTNGAEAAGSGVTPERRVATPPLRDLFGEVLRRVRRQQGRTLREVAAAAQVSMPYLSEVERGRKEASSEVLAAICRALGIRVVDLLAAAMSELVRYEPLPARHTVPAGPDRIRPDSVLPNGVLVVVSGTHPTAPAAGAVVAAHEIVAGPEQRGPVAAVGGARVIRPAGRYEARAATGRQVIHLGAGRLRRGPAVLRHAVRPGPGRPAHVRAHTRPRAGTRGSGGAWHGTWGVPISV